MKTIKKRNEVRRVSDKDAIVMTNRGWKYCPKNLWKEEVVKRPIKDMVEENENISDKKKRKLRKDNKRKRYEGTN